MLINMMHNYDKRCNEMQQKIKIKKEKEMKWNFIDIAKGDLFYMEHYTHCIVVTNQEGIPYTTVTRRRYHQAIEIVNEELFEQLIKSGFDLSAYSSINTEIERRKKANKRLGTFKLYHDGEYCAVTFDNGTYEVAVCYLPELTAGMIDIYDSELFIELVKSNPPFVEILKNNKCAALFKGLLDDLDCEDKDAHRYCDFANMQF